MDILLRKHQGLALALTAAATLFLLTGCGSGAPETPTADASTQTEFPQMNDKLEDTEHVVLPVEDQLQLIAQQKDLWQVKEEFSNNSYAVSDLNNNGWLELISSSTQGSGLFTFTRIYEVDPSGEELVERVCKDLKCAPVIVPIGEETVIPACYDEKADAWKLVTDDYNRDGMAASRESRHLLCLTADGTLTDEILGIRDTEYSVDGSEQVTCSLADGTVISSRDYERLDEAAFGEMPVGRITFRWIGDPFAQEEGDAALAEQLKSSLSGFSAELQ